MYPVAPTLLENWVVNNLKSSQTGTQLIIVTDNCCIWHVECWVSNICCCFLSGRRGRKNQNNYSKFNMDKLMKCQRHIMKYILRIKIYFLTQSKSDLISDTLQLNMNTVNTCKQMTCLSSLYKDYHKPVKFWHHRSSKWGWWNSKPYDDDYRCIWFLLAQCIMHYSLLFSWPWRLKYGIMSI